MFLGNDRYARFARAFAGLAGLALIASAEAQSAAAGHERDGELSLAGFRTVTTAIQAKVSSAPIKPQLAGRTGYLGVHVGAHKNGVVVAEVEPGSPAEVAGIRNGDVITALNGRPIRTQDELRQTLQAASPGDPAKIKLTRAGKPMEMAANLAATSRPMSLSAERPLLGVQLGEPEDDGVPIRRITPGSPAEKAGLKSGDLVLRLDGAGLADPNRLDALLNEKSPGEVVQFVVRRDGAETEVKVKLEPDPAAAARQTGFSPRSVWKKDVYRLAIIPIEYPDVKHNPKVTAADWNEALFSTGVYKDKQNPTGQQVYGSLNDYYRELSVGAFRVDGKVFDWVEVSKNRADYIQGNGTGGRNRLALLTEAMDLLIKRDGDEALRDFDGVFFLYAGARYPTNRGAIYWPHRSSVTFRGKSWPYFIVQEGGERMTNISVMCHEFGHMLGLPDLYARPENPGSEGLGVWCAMSNQAGNGRPQHMSAWCKIQLGWLTPTTIDPTVKQKLILSPVNGSKNECFKVLLRADGSEYLLLENRKKVGFDESLPGEGLLIWHIVGNRPILEESHGVDGPSGPRSFVSMVPYPSEANNAYTPYTTPSSKSQLGGGLPVYITNIRKLPDGRVTFYVGYEFN